VKNEKDKSLSAKLLEERQSWEAIKKCMNEVVSLVHNAILAKQANKDNIAERHTNKKSEKLSEFDKLFSKLNDSNQQKHAQVITEGKLLAEELKKELKQEQLSELNLRIGRFTNQIERIRTRLLQEYKEMARVMKDVHGWWANYHNSTCPAAVPVKKTSSGNPAQPAAVATPAPASSAASMFAGFLKLG